MASQGSFNHHHDNFIRCGGCRFGIAYRSESSMQFDKRFVEGMVPIRMHDGCMPKWPLSAERIKNLTVENDWKVYVKNGWDAFRKHPWAYVKLIWRYTRKESNGSK